MWIVSAIITRNGHTVSIPTFYLHGRIQGIVDEEHAERIARNVCDPYNEATSVSITAMRSHRVFDAIDSK